MSNNISEIEPLNNSLNEIVQNYLSICSNFAIKQKDIESDEILKNEIILLHVSMNDLVIQLQNINFKINTLPHLENTLPELTNPNTTISTTATNPNTTISATATNPNTTISATATNPNTDKKTDKNKNTNALLDKTINDMLPLFMLALMNNDKDSLLNSNTFMNNIKETINSFSNQVSSIPIPIPIPIQSLSHPTLSNPTQSQSHNYTFTSGADDLD